MCFSMIWFENLLIWLVVVAVIFAVMKLLIPYILAQLGGGGEVILKVLQIVMWGVVVIFAIAVCFDLVMCATGFNYSSSIRPR